ncbi:MAG: hypothetical protein KBC26_02965 [Candidatus Pacebacteria bacterium]|nr:hypothetical protein [Candidatus Paceibacterota bacterium]
MIEWVKKIYIYIFSAAGLILVIIGAVQLVNLGLKTWVFTKADMYYSYPVAKPMSQTFQETVQEPFQKDVEEYYKKDIAARRQRQASNAFAMMVIGVPLFSYHWRLARKNA